MRCVHYFSALATHRTNRSPDGVAHHLRYISALKADGVKVEMGRFKKSNKRPCPKCGHAVQRYEEKETDVALSVRVLELFVRDDIDVVVVVSGDTDLAPAIRTAKSLFPSKFIGCLFPYGRKNKELEHACDFSAMMTKEAYSTCQFADQVTLPSGQIVTKPSDW